MDCTPLSRQAGRSRLRLLLILILVGVLVAGAGYWMLHRSGQETSAGQAGGGKRKGAGGGERAQVVSTQKARVQDMRVQVNAIGTLTALNTATVRARVGGELQQIFFKEGQLVQAGQLLAQIDPRSYQAALDQARGQLMRDSAQLRSAELDLKRYRELLEQDSIAAQQVDTQQALVDQLKGVVQADQAQVDAAQLQLSHTRVIAPISGRLGLRAVDVGNMVQTSDSNGIVSITQTRPMAVVFSVPEIHVPHIARQLKARKALPVQAWDREQRQMLAKGHVGSTDNAIDVSTGTLKLKAELANADDALFPNQFVNVVLELDVLTQVLSVPTQAIQRGSLGTFVYVVGADKTVSTRRVSTGVVDGDWTQVQGEVAADDVLVTEGADRLRDGAKVEWGATGKVDAS